MKLQVNNISKQFASTTGTTLALQNVSFTVQTGDFVCIVGASGCGKSSLLNIISGLEKPTTGDVKVQGNIGLMFQEAALFPWLTVFDNVAFGLKMRNVPKLEQKETVKKYLQLMHLEHFSQHYPHQLSGGMKQRVALARTLVLNPDVLLMDEPFAALDALTREHLYTELQTIWQTTKTTIIFVTHNVREAACLGDRILVFSPRPGTIKAEVPVNLPRPRDINHPAVAQISQRVAELLK
ncbi:MAG: ABC transporter ATP-binding protein [Patescibacteria group bacterium]|jgi:NitT/TauT family transport system ATP-binding protein